MPGEVKSINSAKVISWHFLLGVRALRGAPAGNRGTLSVFTYRQGEE